MRKSLIGIVLLACVFFIKAQDFPFFALDSSIPSPLTPQILLANHWWIYDTMPTNINVTNWVDSIANSVWTNATIGTSRPTNSASGVHFSRASSQQLTNSGVLQYTNSATWMLVRRESNGTFQYMISYNNGGGCNLIFYNDNTLTLEYTSATYSDGIIPTNTWFDFVWVNDGVNNKNYFYTNGVPALTNTFYANTAGLKWTFLGGIVSGGFFNGNMREVAVWTNSAINSLTVSNLHYYATNKYGFSP